MQTETERDRPRLHGQAREQGFGSRGLGQAYEKLRQLQYLLFAEGKRSLLICLQALDAAGKDGTINHVLGNMNPQGTRVHSFKVPSQEEAAHDFLWRIHKQTPGHGEVVVFNRSHYEDVLVARVHNLVPEDRLVEALRSDRRFREGADRQRDAHHQVLPAHQPGRAAPRASNGGSTIRPATGRSARRITRSASCGRNIPRRTKTRCARPAPNTPPWYVIPSNHKWFRNLAVSKIVVETLESLDMKFPEPTVDLADIAAQVHAAEQEENGKPAGGDRWKFGRGACQRAEALKLSTGRSSNHCRRPPCRRQKSYPSSS